jgi:hypothetical protein
LRNSIDRCGQPIKDRGRFEVALVIRILFRLLPPLFGLFFEIVPKFHMPNHVIRSASWLSALTPDRQRLLLLALFGKQIDYHCRSDSSVILEDEGAPNVLVSDELTHVGLRFIKAAQDSHLAGCVSRTRQSEQF